MRISDFIRVREAPPLPVRKPLPTSNPSKTSGVHKSASENAEAVETRIREQVESKFTAELNRIQQKAERDFQERLKAEQALLQTREDALQKKEAELRARMETAMTHQSASEEERKAQERDWQRRMEEERRLFQQTLETELSNARRLIQDLEQKLTQKQAVSENSAKTEPDTRGLTPAKEEDSGKMPQTPSKLEPAQFSAISHEHSAQEAKQILEQPDPEILNLDWDASRLDQIRLIRDHLIEVLRLNFEHVEQGEGLSLSEGRHLFQQFIRLIHDRDYEAVRIALEDYPEGARFFGHGVNVAFISVILGREFQLPEKDLTELGLAGLFHDIALSKVKEDLDYPKQLSPRMEKEVLEHPTRGAMLLRGHLSEEAIAGVEQHHEVGEGKGYPKGLEESEIHLYARILHIADSLEALVHQRSYRPKPLEVHEAVKELIDAGRGVYDREVLKAVLIRIGLYPVMTEVELSNKQFGIVVKQNRNFPLSPVVRAELDENNQPLPRPFLIDLSKTQFIHILGAVRKGSDDYASSRFNPVESSAQAGKRREFLDFAQGFLSILMIITLAAVIFYVVIKI